MDEHTPLKKIILYANKNISISQKPHSGQVNLHQSKNLFFYPGCTLISGFFAQYTKTTSIHLFS